MDERPDIKYLPQQCRLLNRDVWAILIRQEDSKLRVVNCLDKDDSCVSQHCAFTANGGEWPFAVHLVPEKALPKDNPSGKPSS